MAHVLIVDDDVDFAEAVATVVRSLQHQVDVRYSTAGVPDEIAADPPDLVILDVMFPEDKSAGFRLAAELRKQHPDLPVLFVTAVNTGQPLGFNVDGFDATAALAAECLEKPIDLDLLAEKVTALLA